MIVDRRLFIGSAVASAMLPACAAGASDPDVFTPEMFGAVGDGRTNDTLAFRRMAEAVNLRGGGVIQMQPRTYIVGMQEGARDGFAFAPIPPLHLSRCTRPLVIKGGGAVLKCVGGLRYGTFDPRTGAKFDHPMPFLERGYQATPYDYMIAVRECSGSIEIRDLELDGSVEELIIGGQWGDTGWQVPAIGLFLADNVGGETVVNLYTHHHAQDGILIRGATAGPDDPVRTVTDTRCEFNGRQGCSFIGGNKYVFRNCRFANTAMVQVHSAPAAGFDIEAEGRPIRNLRFIGCEFSGNRGVGMVADSGDSADVSFVDCRFIGTANVSAWTRKPAFRFDRCGFVGPVIAGFPDASPLQATQFHRCSFTDTGSAPLRGDKPKPGPIVDMGENPDVLFRQCRFHVSQGWQLPWSTRAIYDNCTMRQVGGGQGYPRGTYLGTSMILGDVDLYGSTIKGTVTVNGQRRT